MLDMCSILTLKRYGNIKGSKLRTLDGGERTSLFERGHCRKALISNMGLTEN